MIEFSKLGSHSFLSARSAGKQGRTLFLYPRKFCCGDLYIFSKGLLLLQGGFKVTKLQMVFFFFGNKICWRGWHFPKRRMCVSLILTVVCVECCIYSQRAGRKRRTPRWWKNSAPALSLYPPNKSQNFHLGFHSVVGASVTHIHTLKGPTHRAVKRTHTHTIAVMLIDAPRRVSGRCPRFN